MGKPTPQETKEALEAHGGNSVAAKAVAIVGHFGAGWHVLKGLRAAYATGKLATKAGPLVAVFVGAKIASAVKADEHLLKLAERLNLAERQASPGPEPAHLGHTIAHNHEPGGFLAGLAVGLIVGAAVIFTGGLLAPAAPALIGGAGALAGGFSAEAVAGAGAKMADVTGTIAAGSSNVRFEGQPVARVGDLVMCSCLKHSGSFPIIEGSRTIQVNGMPMARVGHKTQCDAVIQQGCTTISADKTTVTYGGADVDLAEQVAESTIEVLFARWFSKEGEVEADPDPTDPAPTETPVPEERPSAFPNLKRGGGKTNMHADRVVEALRECDSIKPEDRIDRSVTVIEHEDGSVSVGLNGKEPIRMADTKAVVRQLNQQYPHDPPTYSTTQEPVDKSVLEKGPPQGAPPRGRCSEPQAAQAAGENTSPPVAYQTVNAPGNFPNKYPSGDPPTSGGNEPQAPCQTCQNNGPNYSKISTKGSAPPSDEPNSSDNAPEDPPEGGL